MDAVIVTLFLLGAVVASSVLARAAAPLLPLPLPLVQIALGGLIGRFFNLHIAMEPELFLLLFVAPLLFLDGWRTPREGLFSDKWAISALALGLVFFTVAGMGYFIHWMIPGMPLAVAFALGAILSPTDAVAVGEIAERVGIPRRLIHILDAEALLNDAPGLVCMRFAIAAALTGTFSFMDASISFLWLAIGGIAVGAAVAIAANMCKDWIAKHFGESTGSQILISLLIPFATYLLSARLQVSAILAAVVAGIVMNFEERTGRTSPMTRIRRAAVWDALQFAGNGVIFVLLGHSLPALVTGAAGAVRETGHEALAWLLGYVLAITLSLLLLRGLWVCITLWLFRFLSIRGTSAGGVNWRLVAAMSLAGTRGALALAAAMTFPLTLNDGAPFPARDLAIYLTAGVIVVSLVTANVGLPGVVKGLVLPTEAGGDLEETLARLAAEQAAVKAMEEKLRIIAEAQPDMAPYLEAGTRIIEQYRWRIATRSKADKDPALARKIDEIERILRITALRAERDEFYIFARSGRLNDELVRTLIRETDLLESRFAGK